MLIHTPHYWVFICFFLASSLEFSDCEDGQLRLTNYSDTSNTSRNGTLQLCLNHAWGTICADQFYGGADALVACNHLEGFQSEEAMAYSVQQRGDPVFLGQLDCEGDEESLLSCVMYSSIGLVSCESNLDAAVSCRGTCVFENKSNSIDLPSIYHSIIFYPQILMSVKIIVEDATRHALT